MSPARRHRAFMLAAVLAIVCALVPDPVTVARTPTAYAPLDDALFTPVADVGLPSSATPSTGPADSPSPPIRWSMGRSRPRASPPPTPCRRRRRSWPSRRSGASRSRWHTTEVSWYGPGFYGQRTACGEAMTQQLVGVAHRTLPCGTLVTFRWNGHTVRAPVVDRGPYVAGRLWDLTPGLCALLDHCFTGPISWKVT